MLNQKVIFDFFKKLDCTEIETKIYLALIERGDLTTLEISRILNLPRTSLYRELERMKQKGLVEEIIDEYKTKAKAVSGDNLERLVNKKVRDIEELEELFPKIKESVIGIGDLGQSLTKVLYFRGQEAVTRMAWGALETKGLFRGYTHRQFAELIGLKNAFSFKEEWNNLRIRGRDIVSDVYFKHLRKEPKLDTGKWLNWESRYLSPSKLNISHQFDIYNDVVAIYNWYEGEIFGVLIRNKKVADQQKQIFDILWGVAKKIKK